MLSDDLILDTIHEVLWLEQVGHDDVRVTDHLSLHALDSMVQLGSVSVDLVRYEAVNHVCNARLLIKQAAHHFELLPVQVPLLPQRLLVLKQHLLAPLEQGVIEVVCHQ